MTFISFNPPGDATDVEEGSILNAYPVEWQNGARVILLVTTNGLRHVPESSPNRTALSIPVEGQVPPIPLPPKFILPAPLPAESLTELLVAQDLKPHTLPSVSLVVSKNQAVYVMKIGSAFNVFKVGDSSTAELERRRATVVGNAPDSVESKRKSSGPS